MAIRELTATEIQQLRDNRHPTVGLLYPPEGLTPWYDWLIRSLHLLADAGFGALRTAVEEADAPTIRIAPGRASVAGEPVAHPGSAHDLSGMNNTVVLVALVDGGGGAASIELRREAEGWPAVTHLKLAEVTVEAGIVAEVLDRRFEAALRAD
jgi:hypothetical protein